MNRSKEIEELNEIFKKIIDSFSSEKFTCISNLTKEENLISILKEIEPNFEAIGGKLDLCLDSALGVRYENFLTILKAISNYLDKSREKERFLFNTDITKFLNVFEIINQSAQQIILISELLLFICVITSRKNYYIDRIRDLEDTKFVNIFFNKIEKYILLESKEDEYNKSFSELSKSYVGYNSNSTANQNLLNKNSASDFEVYKATKLLLDQERENHRKTIKEYEAEISKSNTKAENYEKTIAELEAKLKDCESELHLLKEKSKFSLKAQEESISNSAFNQELKNQLKSKESEIDDIKRKSDLTVKRLNEELFKAKEKIENLEDKLHELNSLRAQNEKLYTKVKELNIYKDKKIEFENLLTTNETKNKQIELLVKEKQSLLGQIDKLCDDLQKNKEKLSICEYEKKNLEYELQDLKKDFSRLENKQFQNLMNVSDARKSVNFNSNNNNNFLLNNFNSNHMNNINNNNFFGGSRKNNNDNFILNSSELNNFNNNQNNNNNNNINNNFKENEEWVKLNEIGMESVIGDFGVDRGNMKVYDLKEFQDLIGEKNDIMKSLKEQIEQNQSLIMEKDKLSGEINHLKNHIEKLNSENDKILIEKGKLEIFIQKQELELQKHQISFEYESKKYEDTIKNLTSKNEILKNENSKCLQEIENLKYLMANNSGQNVNSKPSSGKKLDEIHPYNTKRVAQGVINLNSNNNGDSPANFSNTNNSSSKRFFFGNKDENNSTSLNSDSKTKIKISPKNQINLSDSVDISSLKNEISNLKKIIQQKEELINILTQQIKTLESNDELERYKAENLKMVEDLEFYKRSYEEQNVRVNKEHEIISSSLYDLALQFMTLKNDLHKKMNK